MLKISEGGVVLNLSLTVFGDRSNPFEDTFIRDVKKKFNGQIQYVDYSTPVKTAANINALVSTQF